MLKRICSILSGIMLIGLLLIAGVLVIPNLIGWKTMAVLSGSMEPEISVGEVVVTKPVEPGTIKTGDIITYRMNENTMVTHRVVEVDEKNKQLTTKGDANDTADGNPVEFSNVVGKTVFHVPYLGYISIYIKSPLGVAGVCAVVIVMILLNALPEIFEKDSGDEK